MQQTEFLTHCEKWGQPLTGYTCTTEVDCEPYVYHDQIGGKKDLRFASAWRVQRHTPGAKPSIHNVVLSFGLDDNADEQFHLWCGDSFLEGKLSGADFRDRVDEALDSATWLHPAQVDRVNASLASRPLNALQASTGCNFWKIRPKPCKHVMHVMAHIINDLRSGPAENSILSRLRQAVRLAATNSLSPLDESAPCSAEAVTKAAYFKSHVLLLGPQGGGKTHLARSLAEEETVGYVEMGCHSGVEAADLLGSVAPYGPKWVWKDGPVTEAFRKAAAGQKVVLCLDELLRVPRRPLSALLTALSPYKGRFYLRTGRILSEDDGVGTEEVLQCDEANLMVVATSNIGAGFDQDQIDPALKSRFTLVFLDNSTTVLGTRLSEAVTARGWPENVAAALLKFNALVESAVDAGLLAFKPNLRVLLRSIKQAESADQVRQALFTEHLQFVGSSLDGKPLQEHVEYVNTILDKAFAAPAKRAGKGAK